MITIKPTRSPAGVMAQPQKNAFSWWIGWICLRSYLSVLFQWGLRMVQQIPFRWETFWYTFWLWTKTPAASNTRSRLPTRTQKIPQKPVKAHSERLVWSLWMSWGGDPLALNTHIIVDSLSRCCTLHFLLPCPQFPDNSKAAKPRTGLLRSILNSRLS